MQLIIYPISTAVSDRATEESNSGTGTPGKVSSRFANPFFMILCIFRPDHCVNNVHPESDAKYSNLFISLDRRFS